MVYPNLFDTLHIGPAGLPAEMPPLEKPPTDGADMTLNGLNYCLARGWNALELSFVQEVYLKPAEAERIAAWSREHRFPISCHGSYYINLASEEKQKIGASRARIVQAAERISQCGGHSVVFHSAFLTGRESAEVSAIVIEQLHKVEDELAAKGVKVWLRPELTGKPVQHGSLDELIKVCNAVETALPCIDWAHQHARTNGGWNSYEEWCQMLDRLATGIKNKNVLQRMHMHVSGIEYGPRGEKRHLPLATADLRYKELMAALKQAGVCGTLACEAPDISQSEDVDRLRTAWAEA